MEESNIRDQIKFIKSKLRADLSNKENTTMVYLSPSVFTVTGTEKDVETLLIILFIKLKKENFGFFKILGLLIKSIFYGREFDDDGR